MDGGSDKKVYYLAVLVGSTIGGYIPTFFGVDAFSLWSIVGSVLGAFFCIYLVYKFLAY